MGLLAELYSARLVEFDTLAPAKDARRGYGYGRASTPTGAGGDYRSRDDFPYTAGPTELDDEVETEDLWSSQDTVDVFLKKTGHRQWKDSGRHGGDRGSLANTSNITGLSEIGIVAIPGLYRSPGQNDETGRKHYSALKTGPGHKGGITPGAKAGWFGSPPPKVSDISEPAYTLQDIPDRAERALQNAQSQHDALVGEYEEEFMSDCDCMSDE